tara:strand:- start:308 stop:502 length:195 start_codon:yes stop_codon:yes gene_type:complete
MKNLPKIEKIQKAFSFSELLILQDLISKERHRIGSSFDILTDQLEKEFKTISDLNTKLKNAINN